MVKSMPFTIMSSAVVDPQEGSSKDNNHGFALEKTDNIIVKKSSSRLLSIDDDNEDGEHHTGTQQTERQANDNMRGAFPSNQFPFSIGSGPTGPPQKFFTTQNKPSFKVSSFVSSSPLIPCGSSSSFYPGRTSFGGTSSLQSKNVKRQKMSPVASNVPRKTSSIKPKTLSSKRGAVTSDTARKILGALERMSSPVKDGSKLPNSPSSVLFKPLRRTTDQSFSLFSSRPNVSLPPTTSLNMTQNVNIQLREQTNEPFRFGSGTIRPSAPVKTFKSHGLPMSFSPDEDYKGGGKMKRQRQQSHYSAVVNKVEESINKLPEIYKAPPLVVSSLPKFDFGVSTVSKQKQTDSNCSSAESKTEVNSSEKYSVGFTFSRPEIISSRGERIGETIPKATFQFSVPTIKEQGNNENKEDKVGEDSPVLAQQSKDDGVSRKPSATKPVTSGEPSGLWNKKSKNFECVKPSEKSTKSPDQGSKLTFANKFKAPAGSWECSECMLTNSVENVSCKACNARKAGDNQVTDSKRSNTSNMQVGTTKILSEKFKKVEGAWDCDSCMLSNKKENNECVACGNKKSGGLSKIESVEKSSKLKVKFAAEEGSWECAECMLQNKPSISECISCKAPKPGLPSAPKSVSFSFGTKGTKSTITFGTGDGTSSVKFGTNCGMTFDTGNLFKNNETGGFNFGNSDKNFGTSFGASEKAPVINFGTSNSAGVVFGNNKATSGGMFGTGVGFSFGAPKDTVKNDPAMPANSSKTEENNNLSNSRVVFASSPIIQTDSMPLSSAKDSPKDSAGKEGIKSIAEAAQAGLLKVPELEKKTDNDINTLNGPTTHQFSDPKSFKFGSHMNDSKSGEASDNSSSSNLLPFSNDSSEKDKKLLPVFSFVKPIVSQGQTSTSVGYSFGSGTTFSFKPTLEQSSAQSTNQSKEPIPFEKMNSSSATGIPGMFGFGSHSTYVFNSSGQSTAQSVNQVKNPTALENSNFSTDKSKVTLHSNFGESSARVTGESPFQFPSKGIEDEVSSSQPFQFSAEPSKPLSGIFTKNSAKISQTVEENKSENIMSSQNTLFTSGASNSEMKNNPFSEIFNPSVTSPPPNMVGASNALPGSKFSFGTNSSNIPNVFGNQQTRKIASGPTSNFNISGLSAQNPNIPMKTFSSADDKSKAFNFVTPSENQGSNLFTFGNSTVNANMTSAGTAGGFNFSNTGNSSTPFSTGTGSSAPLSSRTLKRAVRRKK